MANLLSLARGYLDSAGYKTLLQESDCLVADKLVFGQERDTVLVWAVPPGDNPSAYQAILAPGISKVRPNYPDAKAYVLADSRGGFSRDFLQVLSDLRVKLLVPIWFFDAAFKVEEAPKAVSAIADIRSLAATRGRVPQPFRAEGANEETEGPDLFDSLREEINKNNNATVRLIVGRAGGGKSVLFRALFAHLYEDFLSAKSRQAPGLRPIPLVPEHLKGTYALRTEALLDNFLRTDVASPITRETFEWLLVNGFAAWLLDGLDELYAGDPYFFEYLQDLITRKGSKAQVTIWCRDSVLTTSDAFVEFRDYCQGSGALKVYRLAEWQRASKRLFAWLRFENRQPQPQEHDPPQVNAFLAEVDRSPTVRALSGLPFYCELILQQFREGHLAEFADDVTLLNHIIGEMIQREEKKELLDLRLFVPNGLHEWLEQIAIDYVEGQRYADINRDEAMDYAQLVLRENVDEPSKKHILTSLLQFPLFSAGAETGRITFTHDLIAQALAARAYARMLAHHPGEVGRRLSRTDLDDPAMLRLMAVKLGKSEEEKVSHELRYGLSEGRGFAVLLSLLMIARPERNLLKHIEVNLESRDLEGVRFDGRDLSGLSFRSADLCHASFSHCDLRQARFEGAYIKYTRFDGTNELQGAQFGGTGRIQSLYAGRQFLDDPQRIRDWIARSTGTSEPSGEPCPSALQLFRLFGKYVTPLGQPRRDDLKRDGLVAGKRYPGAASTEACVEEAVRQGYLSGPDFRERFRRAEGDKYAEIVRFVRDGVISDGIGRFIASVCARRGCLHQLRP